MSLKFERILLNENEPVITTRRLKALHNFGPVSYREQTLFTAERPGHHLKEFPTSIVEDWAQFIMNKGIRNVLIIMEDHEFEVYDVDLIDFYEKNGLAVYHIPFSSPDSHQKTMNLIRELDSKGEKIVAHCTGGKGRCGRVACAWLCQKWNISPLQASQELIDQATERGLYRLGDVQKLKKWIGYRDCSIAV